MFELFLLHRKKQRAKKRGVKAGLGYKKKILVLEFGSVKELKNANAGSNIYINQKNTPENFRGKDCVTNFIICFLYKSF